MQPGVERVLVPVGGHVVAADVHLRDDGRLPVVFQHGILTSTEIASDLFVDPATESWVSLSLPGHHPGRLAAGTRAADVDADLFADLTEAALAHVLGDRRVAAVGWSTGGFAALSLAIRHPQRVAAVASLAGFADGRAISGSVAWLAWIAGGFAGAPGLRAGLWAGARLAWLHDAIVWSCTAPATTVPSDRRARMRAAFARHDPRKIATMLAALPRLDLSAGLGGIASPVWIAAGGLDPLVPPAEARRLAAGIRDARLTIYRSGGHLFFEEWPGFHDDFAAWREGLPRA
ncbi:MAG: alpha/beta fold hydrolase [Pirellulales bacterium]